MAFVNLRNSVIGLAAAATALCASAPAMAGGGSFVHVGYNSGYYGAPYGHYRAGYGYHGGRHFHGRRYHRRGGGGRAAAIALGVIGGAIILNEAAEARARDRYYEDRYYDRLRRYDRYSRDARRLEDERDYLPERDYEEGPEDGNLSDDPLNEELAGGREDSARNDGGPEPIRYSYREAYSACTEHAQKALRNRGFTVAAPATPDTAEPVGAAWKMTATVVARRDDGKTWDRAMYCEADESRVYLLELI